MAVAEAALVGVGVSVVQLIIVLLALAEAGLASVPAALAKVVVGRRKLHSSFA
ncbi:MAG: hypothetical protein M5U01_17055 [Ardenticatenaceae bacterium]|nr:hypothetical protein [Ardenticatenaceae bacterium]